MTAETEQLRRLVDAREMATKGPWKADVNLGCKRISAKLFGHHKQAKRTEIFHTVGLQEKEDKANALFAQEAGTIDLRAILTRMEKMEAAWRWYADEGNWQKDPNDVEVLHERKAGGIAKEALE